jgi:hypothetical protein
VNFTYNNHLKYWIGDRLYGYRKSPIDKFTVDIGSIDPDHYRKSDWLSEQYRTADIISKEYGKDFVVMFSGGTDSEIVLRSFKKIGVVPRCIFLRFPNEANHIDLVTAQKVCKELDWNLEVIDHDLISFYRSGEAAEFSVEIQCRQMAYLNVYYMVRKLQLPAVMGGEMLLRRRVYRNKPGAWFYCFRENEDASAMRFSLKYNIPLVNEWFSYTPEMIAYYLENPDIISLTTNLTNGKLSSVTSKNKILQQYMPDIIEKNKTHGFEKLLGFNQETYEKLYTGDSRRLEFSLDGIMLEDLKNKLYSRKNENHQVN